MPRSAFASRRAVLSALFLVAGLAAFAGAAGVQAYPSKPTRILVRAAGGVTGTQQLVRAPKDGYTLAVPNNNHVINPSVYKDMPFDNIKDILPISNIGSTPLVLATNLNVP